MQKLFSIIETDFKVYANDLLKNFSRSTVIKALFFRYECLANFSWSVQTFTSSKNNRKSSCQFLPKKTRKTILHKNEVQLLKLNNLLTKIVFNHKDDF